MPNFEVFTHRAARFAQKPIIGVQSRGNISLNMAAYQVLGQPEAVELLFDRAARIMGIRPIEPEKTHAYVVRKQPNSSSYLLAGRAFCMYYGIDLGVTRRFDATMDGDTLTADLKQENTEVTSGRAAHRATAQAAGSR